MLVVEIFSTEEKNKLKDTEVLALTITVAKGCQYGLQICLSHTIMPCIACTLTVAQRLESSSGAAMKNSISATLVHL